MGVKVKRENDTPGNAVSAIEQEIADWIDMKVKKFLGGEGANLEALQDKKLKGQLAVREELYGKSAQAAAKAKKMDSQYNDTYTSMLMNDSPNFFDETGDFNPTLQSQSPNEVNPAVRKSQRTKNFSREEDIMLVSAWLNTNKDAITENEQQCGTFWGRINVYFVNQGGAQAGRSAVSLRSRWSDINAKCAKFAGCLNQLEQSHGSVQTEQGRHFEARKMYASLMGKHFQFDHCWDILKHERKWSDNLCNKKQKIIEDISPTSPATVNLGEHIEPSTNPDRPLSRKVSKQFFKSKKRKDKGEDYTSVSYKERRWQEMMALEREKAERHERALQQHQRQLDIQERQYKMQVMQIDTSNMDPATTAYWNSLKFEIMTNKGFN